MVAATTIASAGPSAAAGADAQTSPRAQNQPKAFLCGKRPRTTAASP